MNNMLPLKTACNYTKERIESSLVSIDNFVTTDNLLQNKAGIEKAVGLPPQSGYMPKYSQGDILVANIRPYLKKIWFANKEGGCSADVLVYNVKKGYDPKFIYYSMFRDDFFYHTMKGSKGTKMPRGDKKQMMEFLIPDFNLSKQKAIASVLSSLDAKIELNNHINAELEAMAKTLYDYWFVQFEFPMTKEQAEAIGKAAAAGKPYKSSGGKMVYNKELKREIPEGWTIGELQEIANITMGQSPPGDSYNEDGIGTVFYQGCTDFGLRFPTNRKFTTEPSRFAKEGDILLSVRAPVGTMNIANEDCCIGRGLASLNSKDDCIGYLDGVLNYMKQIFDRRNSDGTTFGSITKGDLFSLVVIKPDKTILKRFDTIVKPMFKKQNQIGVENQQLATLRDWLLPMLMNGQLSVRQAHGSAVKEVKEKLDNLNMAAEPESKYKTNGI